MSMLRGKGGMERRKEPSRLEPWQFDRRKPLLEEIGRIKDLSDKDTLKFSHDFSMKILDPVYVAWVKNKIKYEVMASPNEK